MDSDVVKGKGGEEARVLGADEGSSSTSLGDDAVPGKLRTVRSKKDTEEERRLSENSASKGRGAIKDDVAGEVHGDVPERHELGFGPVGA